MQSPTSIQELTLAMGAHSIRLPSIVNLPTGRNREPYIVALRNLGIIANQRDTVETMKNKHIQALSERGYTINNNTAVLSSSNTNYLPQEISMDEIRNQPAIFISRYELHSQIKMDTTNTQLFNDLVNYLTVKGYVLNHQNNTMVSYGQPVAVKISDNILQNKDDPIISAVDWFIQTNCSLSLTDWEQLARIESDIRGNPSLESIRNNYTSLSPNAQNIIYIYTVISNAPHKSMAKLNRRYPTKHRNMRANIYTGLFEHIILQPGSFHVRDSYPSESVSSKISQLENYNPLYLLLEGYDILPNNEATNDVLIRLSNGHSNIFKDDGHLLLKTLVHYPQMVGQIINHLPTIFNSFAWSLAPYFFPRTPSMYEMWYLILVGAVVMFPDRPDSGTRLSAFKKFTEVYYSGIIRLYERLYDVNNLDLGSIARLPQHPLEMYILRMVNVPISRFPEFVKGYGMHIPKYLEQVGYVNYVLDNMGSYVAVAERGLKQIHPPPLYERLSPTITEGEFHSMITEYTDDEMFEVFGYPSAGNISREVIYIVFHRSLTHANFMLLPKLNSKYQSNTETTLLTSTDDLPGPYLVFGTPFDYHVYEFDEIMSAFHEEELRIPENPRAVFIPQHCIRLQNIIRFVEFINPSLRVITQQIYEKLSLHDYELQNESLFILKEMIENQESFVILKDLFMNIFYAGMYMRRWEGPGHEYPITSIQTRSPVDPMIRTPIALGKVSDILDTIEKQKPYMYTVLKDLKIANYTQHGNICNTVDRLLHMIGQVSNGNYCIRMASTQIIQSAYIYTFKLFGTQIPDINPSQLDHIS